MAKRSSVVATDRYLDSIKTGSGSIGPANKIVLCSAEPTNYTQANVTFALASAPMNSGNFTISAGDVGGNFSRKLTVAAKNSVPVTASGTATHVALLDTVNSLVMYVATCASKSLVNGGSITIPSWKIEIGAPG